MGMPKISFGNLFNVFKNSIMNTITINGTTTHVKGRNISVKNNKIYVDGDLVAEGLSGDVNVKFEGDLANLDATSVEVNGNVTGNVDCTSFNSTGNVGGKVNCTSANIGGDVGGSVDGTTINIGGSVHGDVDAATVITNSK